MNYQGTDRIINRHFIGVVKEINERLCYMEEDIPQDDVLIEKIEAMKKDDDSTLMDIQQLFTMSYPEELLCNKRYNYLYPNKCSSAFVSSVRYPKILSFYEYEEKLVSYEQKIRNEEFLKKIDHNGDLEKLKSESAEKYNERIDVFVKSRMHEYIKSLCKNFYCSRFIYAHRYSTKLNEILNNDNVKMWSTDKIGWQVFEYIVNEDITVYIKSNFGYGSSSYFFCNLKYKDINILPYTAVVQYYYVNWIEFERHTKRFATDRNSWPRVFEFAVIAANTAKFEPERFVREWIINEVEDMMKGIRYIMESPKDALENYLNINHKIEKGSYRVFQNCPKSDKEDFLVQPNEFVVAFKSEKITGCLFLLDNLKRLTDIAPIIIPYIQEIKQMNKQILPEIDNHIEILTNEINLHNNSLEELQKTIDSLDITMVQYKKSIEEVRKEMSKKASERMKYGYVEFGFIEAEREYKKTHPEYWQFKEQYDREINKKDEMVIEITRRERFLKNLNKCKDRIRDYNIEMPQ